MKKLLAVLLPLALGAVLVNCGTKEETKTTPVATAVTYNGAAKAALATNCVGCHNSTGTKYGEVALDTFALSGAAAARVKVRILQTTLPMPPASSPALSAADKKTLTDWIDGGAIEK